MPARSYVLTGDILTEMDALEGPFPAMGEDFHV